MSAIQINPLVSSRLGQAHKTGVIPRVAFWSFRQKRWCVVRRGWLQWDFGIGKLFSRW